MSERKRERERERDLIKIYHHHVTPSARISLTLSRHPSQSSIPSCWCSGLHPVSAQKCCVQVVAGRPAFARPCERVHRSTSLMSSSLLLQHVWFVKVGWFSWWSYSCCFVGCCLQVLFNITRSILA